VVENYLYADLGALVAPGGTGKTTLFLFEAIHVALGIPLYGLKVISPGPIVVITAEDSTEVLYARLRELMAGLGLDDGQKTEALTGIYIADLCGQGLRLLRRSEGVIKSTGLPDHIIERYGPIKPSQLCI
jgi:regulatory protein RepA